MRNVRFIGLDVHAETIRWQWRLEMQRQKIAGSQSQTLELLGVAFWG